MAQENKRDQLEIGLQMALNRKSVRWHRRRDIESRKADYGMRAGVLIEDDQQSQNGRTVMVPMAYWEN
jgi:hypothetical protein